MLDYFMEQFKVLQYEHLAILWGTNIVSDEQAWMRRVCYYANPNLSIWILNLLSAVAKETTAALHLIYLIRLEKKRVHTRQKNRTDSNKKKIICLCFYFFSYLKALYRKTYYLEELPGAI